MKLFLHLTIVFFVFVTISCAPPTYVIFYDSHLQNSNPPSLISRDSNFVFEFCPVPNGILFNINNLTNTPATLEWDRCYFIDPSGNSSKSLNIDLINENSKTSEKAKYESVIPPMGSFRRFTTSALNMHEFTVLETKQVSTDYLTGHIYGNSISLNTKSTNFNSSSSLEITGPRTGTINTSGNATSTSNNISSQNYSYHSLNTSTISSYSILKTFYNCGRYWPDYLGPEYEPADSLHTKDIALPKISNYVKNNNNMGIGFSIKIKDTTIDYKFDFKIDKIAIYEVRDSLTNDLILYTNDTENWVWKKPAISVPSLSFPENDITIDSLPVVLEWNKVKSANYYSVQVSLDSSFSTIIIQDTSKYWRSETLNNLKNKTNYYWRISAKNSNEKSDWSYHRHFYTNFKRNKN